MKWPVDWGDPVMILAGNHWDGLASSERHLSLHLAEYAPLVYVDPPRIEWPRRHRVLVDHPHPRVMRVAPAAIRGMYRVGLQRILPYLVIRTVTRALREAGLSPRASMVAAPTTVPAEIGGKHRALYATDDWVAGAELMGVPNARMRRIRRQQVQSADLVIAVSDGLAATYRELGHPNVAVVPNGCEAKALEQVDAVDPPADVHLPTPIAGYVGNLSDRIDIECLIAVAELNISLLLVGPRRHGFAGDQFDELVARPNVQWVGAQPYSSIPSYLRMIDVGLTPYADTGFNRASSPLKTIEYLAAGRGSVATDLPGVRALNTALVVRASGPKDFADAVQREIHRQRTPQLIDARRAAARKHDWSVRAKQVAALLGLDVDSKLS